MLFVIIQYYPYLDKYFSNIGLNANVYYEYLLHYTF